jgi:MoxR-like ATPase
MSYSILSNDERPVEFIEQMITRVESVMIGKRDAILKTFLAMLSGGHVLIEDVPGVGKTMLVRAVAQSIGCSFQRIQFTPDVLPSDITGVSVYNPATLQFEYRSGPLMANLVLADEINRTSPRTQSALLEAMEERRVTVDGVTRRLPEPFILLATQNPLDFEGTYRLPEAQLDRFLLRIKLGFPDPMQEVELLNRMQQLHPIDSLRPIVMAEDIVRMQREVRAVHVDEAIKHYMVLIAQSTRAHADIALGASPRASLAWMRAAQAHAYMHGRAYVVPDDAKETAMAVLAHRLVLSPQARMMGVPGEELLAHLIGQAPVPMFRSESGARRG